MGKEGLTEERIANRLEYINQAKADLFKRTNNAPGIEEVWLAIWKQDLEDAGELIEVNNMKIAYAVIKAIILSTLAAYVFFRLGCLCAIQGC